MEKPKTPRGTEHIVQGTTTEHRFPWRTRIQDKPGDFWFFQPLFRDTATMSLSASNRRPMTAVVSSNVCLVVPGKLQIPARL